MNKIFFLILFLIFNFNLNAEENMMILKLKDGDVKIELFEVKAPNHVKRIKELADKGLYDNVVFHRVIDGFMAQVGDVQFGNSSSDNFVFSATKLHRGTRISFPFGIISEPDRNCMLLHNTILPSGDGVLSYKPFKAWNTLHLHSSALRKLPVIDVRMVLGALKSDVNTDHFFSRNALAATVPSKRSALVKHTACLTRTVFFSSSIETTSKIS